jgi:hypothetical protein
MRSIFVSFLSLSLLGLVVGCGGSDKVVMPAHPLPKPTDVHPTAAKFGGGSGRTKIDSPPAKAPPQDQ